MIAPKTAITTPATTANTQTVASGQTAATIPPMMMIPPPTQAGQAGPAPWRPEAISATPPMISDTPMRTPRIQIAAKGLISSTMPRPTSSTPTTISHVPLDLSMPSYSAGRGGGGISVVSSGIERVFPSSSCRPSIPPGTLTGIPQFG